jgi:hypothetical protein
MSRCDYVDVVKRLIVRIDLHIRQLRQTVAPKLFATAAVAASAAIAGLSAVVIANPQRQ